MVDFAFQALKLILQPDSEDDLEVDYYESSNESVEDEDFAEDVPKIDGNPECETSNDGELNNEPSEGKKTVLFTFFKAPKIHVNNTADKQENISKKRGNPNVLSAPNVIYIYIYLYCFYILW